jgi:hypothetical protein
MAFVRFSELRSILDDEKNTPGQETTKDVFKTREETWSWLHQS